jgi:hypothetical protein
MRNIDATGEFAASNWLNLFYNTTMDYQLLVFMDENSIFFLKIIGIEISISWN